MPRKARTETATSPPSRPWPADAVERWPIDRLVPYARNARDHTPRQIERLQASMREWGWTNPVLVAEDGTIIAGHARIMAAKALGLTEASVMVARGWSEAQRRAYVIADNQLAIGGASWLDDTLRSEIAELESVGFDLDLLGFEPEEIASFSELQSFQPVGIEEQARLDEKRKICCPECGHEFPKP